MAPLRIEPSSNFGPIGSIGVAMSRLRTREKTRKSHAGVTITYESASSEVETGRSQGTPITMFDKTTTDVIEVSRRKKSDDPKPDYAELGLKPPQFFTSNRKEVHSVPRVNGRIRTTRVIGKAGAVSYLALPDPLPLTTAARNPAYAVTLWAKTNPYRFEISVPVMISELVEAVTLIKFAGGSLLGQIGGNYLNITFGWQPLISDIRKLAKITKIIESRAKELESMAMKGGLRRSHVFLDSVDVENEIRTDYAGAQQGTTVFRGPLISKRSYQVYGSCRWKYKGTPPSLTKLERFNLAVAKVLDFETIDLATIWEAIPFSWLIDYFTQVGEWLQATEGRLEITPFDTFITYVGETRRVWEGVESSSPTSDIKLTGGFNASRRQIRREPVSWNPDRYPPISIGWLTPGQEKNVAALLATLAFGTKRS